MSGQTFLLGALAVLPCCILLAFFVRNDQVEASSRGFRILAPSILGALTAPLALALQNAVRPYWDVDPVTITVSSAIYCFAVIALSEESLKFTVAWIFRRRFKEPYDGIVFAVAAAMGFALVENVRYVFAAGLEAGLMRSVLAVPAHALFGVCIGYFLGRARFCRKFSQRLWNTVAAFGWAWVMHGTYDCTLIYAGKGPSLLLFPLVGVFWLAALWEMDLHVSQSPFRYYPRGDRRVWARYQLDSPARVFPPEQVGEGIPVFIHDIGLGGVQLLCAVELPNTDDLLIAEHPLRLRLEFEILAEQIHERQTMYRCRFATMNWRTRKRFELFLHEVLSRAEGEHSDSSAPPQQ